MKASRQKFPTRKIILRTEQQRQLAHAALDHAPLDNLHPIEVVFREEIKARKPDQNALMWAGPLKDISEQAYVGGRTYSEDIWHHKFKVDFLPEEYDPELCKSEDYKKWDFTPDGDRHLVGSTTDLTVKGFALHVQQIEAFGASMGVLFHANPNEARRAA